MRRLKNLLLGRTYRLQVEALRGGLTRPQRNLVDAFMARREWADAAHWAFHFTRLNQALSDLDGYAANPPYRGWDPRD